MTRSSRFRNGRVHVEVGRPRLVRWPFGVFEYRVHDDPEDSIAAESLAELSQAALGEWASASCARLSPVYSGTTLDGAALGDGKNTVEFVETDWDRLGYPQEATGATVPSARSRAEGARLTALRIGAADALKVVRFASRPIWRRGVSRMTRQRAHRRLQEASETLR